MLLKSILFLYFCLKLANADLYSTYTGAILTDIEEAEYNSKCILETCAIDIKPCDESEGRREDGSCSNPEYPTKGTAQARPEWRVAPVFNNGEPRKSVSGCDLPSAKAVRKSLLCVANISDDSYTQGVVSGVFSIMVDSSPYYDSLYPIITSDQMSKMTILPKITAMNGTEPIFFQTLGCTDDEVPVPVSGITPTFDLSYVYQKIGDEEKRSFENGHLATEKVDGKEWPLSAANNNNCPMNQEDESMCFENYFAVHMPVTLWTVWFIRLHNYFADKLSAVNPCWDDDKLYNEARILNVAAAQSIYVEWLTAILGREFVMNAGILGKTYRFRKTWDSSTYPVGYVDLVYALRAWFTVVDTNAKMYDANGTYVKSMNMVNHVCNPGYLGKDNNMELLTQGQIRQSSGKIDNCIDTSLATDDLDIMADNLERGRNLGIAPYIDYVRHYFNINITCFEDLSDLIDEENIKKLKDLYTSVEDIDLMSGIEVETLGKIGSLSPTVAYMLIDLFSVIIKADRNWLDSEDRTDVLTLEQLQEISEHANLAEFLCAVGDGVTEVQRNAFLLIDENNPLVRCSDYTHINFNAWADPTCPKTTGCVVPSTENTQTNASDAATTETTTVDATTETTTDTSCNTTESDATTETTTVDATTETTTDTSWNTTESDATTETTTVDATTETSTDTSWNTTESDATTETTTVDATTETTTDTSWNTTESDATTETTTVDATTETTTDTSCDTTEPDATNETTTVDATTETTTDTSCDTTESNATNDIDS